MGSSDGLINNIEETLSNQTLRRTDLVDEEIVKIFTENKELERYITMREITTQSRVQVDEFETQTVPVTKNYLVGYPPIRNLYPTHRIYYHDQIIGKNEYLYCWYSTGLFN